MTYDLILANAEVVLADETIRGSVAVREGHVVEVSAGASVPAGAEDCEGAVLAPGLVELHTDNLERHLRPRPKVNWPHAAAILAHDRELASTGITTVFDAVRVGSIHSNASAGYAKYARQMTSEILAMRDAGALRISHHLHLRAETCSETLIDELNEFTPDDRVGILSMMDHTPGQRQFSDISKFEDYIRGKHGMSKESFDEYVSYLKGLRNELGERHEAETVAAAARLGASLASHDDSTRSQVAQSAKYGVAVAEFPTTVEAAEACRDAGIAVIMGAPNLVRGGSHSGNVAAETLARLELLDILSSDYVPASLLMGAVKLARIWGSMARALATVSAAPARAVGLTDRGTIEPGKRADLIRFRLAEDQPVLTGAWSVGTQVA
ncbi:MAG: alpha-D-ribose 1-methylphosphonate 5-triphosphate diphosphatase [Pseudomonadota bacterium]